MTIGSDNDGGMTDRSGREKACAEHHGRPTDGPTVGWGTCQRASRQSNRQLQLCGEKRVKIPTMRKSLSTLAALLLMGGNAFADSFRVHYSIHGSGRDITVQAESSAEARRIVRRCSEKAAW